MGAFEEKFGFSEWITNTDAYNRYKTIAKQNGRDFPAAEEFIEMSVEFSKTLPPSQSRAYMNMIRDKQTLVNANKGVSPLEDSFSAYKRLAGEQEARATQAKLKHPELDPYAALAKEEGVLPEPLVKFDDGVNYSKELSKKYFFKDGRINESALRRESVPFRKLDYTIENFKSEFPEGSVKTPHGEVKIHEHQFTKLGHKNRESLFGLIKPTLEEPSFTVEFEDVTVFFKPFRDNKGIVKFASISKDKDDYLVITSNYALTGGKFEKIVRTGKLLVPEASGKKALNHSSGNKSIPQKPTDVKKEAK